MSDDMTDTVFRERYIARFIERMTLAGHERTENAAGLAANWYLACSRADMTPELQSDPEAAADAAFDDWAERREEDDDGDAYDHDADDFDPMWDGDIDDE